MVKQSVHKKKMWHRLTKQTDLIIAKSELAQAQADYEMAFLLNCTLVDVYLEMISILIIAF